jgi:flavin reductase (DIM6/NTAB) family NADH-FMN oxidoreductase RutF
MKSLITHMLVGTSLVRDYMSITLGDKIEEQVWLKTNLTRIDISHSQWILALDPLVFGVWLDRDEVCTVADHKEHFFVEFSNTHHNVHASPPKTVSCIRTELLHRLDEPGGSMFLLLLKSCSIRHFSLLKTQLLYHFYYRRPQLSFERFKSCVSAFSYPRKVSIISCGKGNQYNIFPMDFVGEVKDKKHFVFGLRHSNRSIRAIVDSGEMVVSEVPSSKKKEIYELGRHHQEPLPAPDSLGFGIIRTGQFGMYVPDWATSYREVKIARTLNLGSHMMLWGETVNQSALGPAAENFFHVHFLHYLHQKKRGVPYRELH